MTIWDNEKLPLNKLYGVQKGYIDNAIKIEFDSGRVESFKKNTAEKMRFTMSYAATKEQETIFFNWYENELGGNAAHFLAPSLRGTGELQEYRFENTPTSSGMNIKQISMIWVEV